MRGPRIFKTRSPLKTSKFDPCACGCVCVLHPCMSDAGGVPQAGQAAWSRCLVYIGRCNCLDAMRLLQQGSDPSHNSQHSCVFWVLAGVC